MPALVLGVPFLLVGIFCMVRADSLDRRFGQAQDKGPTFGFIPIGLVLFTFGVLLIGVGIGTILL